MSHAQTVSWTNATSGLWSDPTRWTPAGVPTPTSSAQLLAIGASHTITVDAPAEVANLTLGSINTTLHLSSALTVQRFDFRAGRLTGGLMTLRGVTGLAELGLPGGGVVPAGSSNFQVLGSLALRTANGSSGTLLSLPASVSLHQRATATSPITSFSLPTVSLSGYISSNGFINNGSIRLSADIDTTSSSMSIGASNTLLVNRGDFRIEGGSSGANTRTLQSGFWNDPSAAARFDTSTTVGGPLGNSGNLTIAPNATVTALNVTQTGGTLDVTNANLLTRDFGYTGGTIIGTPILDGSGASVTLRFESGTPSVAPASFIARGSLGIQNVLTTSGAVQAMPAGVAVRQVAVSPAVTTFLFPSVSLPGGGTGFSNEGTITLEADPGTTNSNMQFGLSNATFRNLGSLVIRGGSSNSNLRTVLSSIGGSGNLTVETSTVFNSSVDVGTFVVKPGQTVTAAGVGAGGSVDVRNAELITPQFTMWGGSVLGKPILRNTGGNARLTINPQAVLTSQVALDVRSSLDVQNVSTSIGTLITLDRNFSIEMRANAMASTLSLNLPSVFISSPISGNGLINAGTIRLFADGDTTASSITVNLPSGQLVNRGAIVVEAGSSVSNARVINPSVYNDQSGTLSIQSNTTLNGAFTNRGNVIVGAGSTLNVVGVTQVAGLLDVRGTALSTSRFDFTGGTVLGTVTMDMANTATLGLPPGLSTVLQPASFDVPASLAIGTAAGSVGTPGLIPIGMTIHQRATAARPTISLTYPSVALPSDQGGNAFINDGSLRFSADAGTVSSSITIGTSGTTLLNRGQLRIEGGSSATNTRSLQGALLNDVGGSVELHTPASFGSFLTNRGTFTLAPGVAISVAGFTQAGGVLDAGAAFLTATNFGYQGGSIVGTPRLYSSSGVATLSLPGSANLVLDPARFDVTDSLSIGLIPGTGASAAMLPAGLTLDLHATALEPTINFLFPLSPLPSPYSGSGTISAADLNLFADADTSSSSIQIGTGAGMLVNRGRVTVGGGSSSVNTRTIATRFYNDADATLSVQTTTTAMAVQNAGRIDVASGATLNTPNAESLGGSWEGDIVLSGTAPMFVYSGATQFEGTLHGDMAVQPGGSISPGIGAGELTVTGTLSFAAPASVKLDFASTTSFDQLSAGSFISEGTNPIPVLITPMGSFTPLPGMRFADVIASSAGPLAVSFSTVNQTGYSGLNFTLEAQSTSMLDLVVSASAGDVNLDGAINFDDLLRLAQEYGSTTGQNWLDGDLSGDGGVGFDDLLILAQNYAGGAAYDGAIAAEWRAALAMAPEPAALGLIAALFCLSPRRRSRVAWRR